MRKSNRINGHEKWLLRKMISKLTVNLELEGFSDAESQTDGIQDSIDKQLTYAENKQLLLDEFVARGLDINGKQDIADIQERINRLTKELLLFKKKVFYLRGNLEKMRKEELHYSKGYYRLITLFKAMEENPYSDVLDTFGKNDYYTSYNGRLKKSPTKHCNFNQYKPFDKNHVQIKKLSERDLVRSMNCK